MNEDDVFVAWVLFIWFFLCVVAGVIARKKGRSGFGLFLLAFFFSPLIGIIVALLLGRNQSKIEARQLARGQARKCPYCAEIVKPEATICRYCNKEISGITQSAERRETAKS